MKCKIGRSCFDHITNYNATDRSSDCIECLFHMRDFFQAISSTILPGGGAMCRIHAESGTASF